MSFEHDDMIRKVQGLLTTAESLAEQGNQGAADAYVAKATALMSKFSIDQAMLADKTGNAEKISSQVWTLVGPYGRRRVSLAHRVTTHFDCAGYFGKTYRGVGEASGGYRWTIYGYESDLELAQHLFESLDRQCLASLSASKGEKAHYEHGRTFGTAFVAHFIDAVGSRLSALKREARRAAQAVSDQRDIDEATPGPHSVSLVLASKVQKVKDELMANVGGLRHTSLSYVSSAAGAKAGYRAGRNATISRGSVGQGVRGAIH